MTCSQVKKFLGQEYTPDSPKRKLAKAMQHILGCPTCNAWWNKTVKEAKEYWEKEATAATRRN